jgi:hypothetical protein
VGILNSSRPPQIQQPNPHSSIYKKFALNSSRRESSCNFAR